MNFYKRHIGDYIKDAGHLTLLEHGVYTRLLDVYYTRESGIPADKAARLIGARSKDEVQALANVLEEFFTLTDGTWTQGRCEAEIVIASEKADQNRENGKKGGRPKRKVSEQEPTNNPSGFVSDSENNLSQTPDTRHQTPDINLKAKTPPDGAPIPSAVGALCIVMRKFGINANPGDLTLCKLADDGVSVETIQAACETAKQSKPSEAIGPAYVIGIVQRWAREAAALNAKGAGQPRASPRQALQANAQKLTDRIQRKTSHEPDDRIIDINDRPA